MAMKKMPQAIITSIRLKPAGTLEGRAPKVKRQGTKVAIEKADSHLNFLGSDSTLSRPVVTSSVSSRRSL